mgnify:CR=1 FL=1
MGPPGPGGRRRIVRTDLTSAKMEVLTERYEGKRYNSPNDVVVDPIGRIWFTDPLYALDRSTMEHPDEAVYRIDTDGKVTRVITQPAIGRPNGLAITPDGKTMYVIDSNYIQPDAVHILWNGVIVKEGGPELVHLLEERGYDWIKEEVEAFGQRVIPLGWCA